VNKFINILIFMLYSFFSGMGLILLKIAVSSRSVAFNMKSIINFISLKLVIGFFFYIVGFILWMFILSKFKLNVAFPIAMSLFFIVSSLGSIFILKESFNINNMIGIVFCLIGIVIITIKP
jgi:drug/metabolite transporter (DMT)-like permease